MKTLLATAALLISVTAASAGPECIGDRGRCHGYMPSGFIGAHPSNRGPHSCTWSATVRCAAWRAGKHKTYMDNLR